MELTINHRVIDTVRLLNEFGQEFDGEHNQKVSMEIAKLALWYESCRDSGFSHVKAFEHSLKITGFSKEKEGMGEICVICNEEYKVGEMIATMECKHSYHEDCIMKWLPQNDTCPICRGRAFLFRL